MKRDVTTDHRTSVHHAADIFTNSSQSQFRWRNPYQPFCDHVSQSRTSTHEFKTWSTSELKSIFCTKSHIKRRTSKCAWKRTFHFSNFLTSKELKAKVYCLLSGHISGDRGDRGDSGERGYMGDRRHTFYWMIFRDEEKGRGKEEKEKEGKSRIRAVPSSSDKYISWYLLIYETISC